MAAENDTERGMSKDPVRVFDDQYVKDCLRLARQKFPEVWERLDAHETGRQPIKTREEYQAVLKPVRIFLFNGGYSNGSVTRVDDLLGKIRFENRRQLGLE